MIVFLTLLYVAALAVAVWLGFVKLNLWWKLSPIAWMALLLVVLFIPMQWGAPTGRVVAYRPVVEIVPNVSGEVVEVDALGMKAMKAGDVLFKIDPVPYQAEVDRLRAGLKEAEQQAAALPDELAEAKAGVSQAQASLVNAQQRAIALQSDVDVAQATVERTETESKLADAELARRQKLEADAPRTITKEEIQEMQAKAANAKAEVDEAQAKLRQAKLAVDAKIGDEATGVAMAQEALASAEAAERIAQLALDATIDGENVAVAQLKAQLTKAEYDLDQTVVRAPSAGTPVAVSLRPGQRVAALPMRGWIAFLRDEKPRVAVGIPQYAARYVRPGQSAEVIFKAFPGRTFSAKVESVAYMTHTGQVEAEGVVPLAPDTSVTALPFGAILAMDEMSNSETLPGGAVGNAAIYTDHATSTHVIRKVMLRQQSWMNYVLP